MPPENTPNFYAIIPANVRYCKELEPNAKLLYGEITALCNQHGYCWASNQYFCEQYDVDDRTIRRWLESLQAQKFINVEINRSGFQTSRKIWISQEIKKMFTAGQKCPHGRTKMSERPDKNARHNITCNNTYEKKTPPTSSKLDPPKPQTASGGDDVLKKSFKKGLKDEAKAERALKFFLKNKEAIEKIARNPIAYVIDAVRNDRDLDPTVFKDSTEKNREIAKRLESLRRRDIVLLPEAVEFVRGVTAPSLIFEFKDPQFVHKVNEHLAKMGIEAI